MFASTPAAESATFHPVDPDRWPDLVRLFEHHGNPGYCWCMRWRVSGRAFNALGVPGRKAALEERVQAGDVIGILGYLAGEPFGWCSIAPRETYAALERTRARRRVADRPAWAVVCFYLRPQVRGRGFARRLLEAAVAFARARGATIVEGYPPEPGATSYRWMGSVATFEAAGFRTVGSAGGRRIVRYVADQRDSGEIDPAGPAGLGRV